MILAALLFASSASLGLGAWTSQGIGEDGPAVVAHARAEVHRWRLSAEWDSSDKVVAGCESGPCWRAGAWADRQSRHLIVGGGLSWRQTPTWTKLRVWGRGGFRTRIGATEARLLASSAILSWDRDSHIEASWRLPVPRLPALSIEPGWELVLFDQGRLETNKRLGSALRVLALYQLGRRTEKP
jgi:hypothetical protein